MSRRRHRRTAPPVAARPRDDAWGLPARCPSCGDYGYVDRIDLIDEFTAQHCRTCWHRWKVSRAAPTEPAVDSVPTTVGAVLAGWDLGEPEDPYVPQLALRSASDLPQRA